MFNAQSTVAVAAFFVAYLVCGGCALKLSKRKEQTNTKAILDGNSGEKRVHVALAKAGYNVLTDLTVKIGNGTHQIDHVVCGQDRLFVLETKTWRGLIEGRPNDKNWKLIRPRSRSAITAYNPIFQNETHAKVISSLCRIPITPLVVSAGFLRVSSGLENLVIPLASLPSVIGPPNCQSEKVLGAFAYLSKLKTSSSQERLSKSHKIKMIYGNKFSLVRTLLVACIVSFGCFLVSAYQMFSG